MLALSAHYKSSWPLYIDRIPVTKPTFRELTQLMESCPAKADKANGRERATEEGIQLTSPNTETFPQIPQIPRKYGSIPTPHIRELCLCLVSQPRISANILESNFDGHCGDAK